MDALRIHDFFLLYVHQRDFSYNFIALYYCTDDHIRTRNLWSFRRNFYRTRIENGITE